MEAARAAPSAPAPFAAGPGWTLYCGDNQHILPALPPAGIHACVTDPPYGLRFMGRRWDYSVPSREQWAAVLRCLRPGAHVAAFGGARTYHRAVCAIEDAGLEVRDTLLWIHGQGFPKGRDLGKLETLWKGWNTTLKPAHEPICLARRPLIGTVAETMYQHGCGGINIGACMVGNGKDRASGGAPKNSQEGTPSMGGNWRNDAERAAGPRWPPNIMHDGSPAIVGRFPAVAGSKGGAGGKDLGGGTVFGGFRAGHAKPRHLRQKTDSGSAARFYPSLGYTDADAAGFFYHRKASPAERAGSDHPTIKPIAVMRWLVRLICPPGGIIIDPWAGYGTTGAAAIEEGATCILIENDPGYCRGIADRLSAMT